jgi:hypothetical protein
LVGARKRWPADYGEKAQRLDGLAAIVARFILGGLFDNPAGKRDRSAIPA